MLTQTAQVPSVAPTRDRAAVCLFAIALVFAAGVYLFLVMRRGDVFFAQGDPAGRVFDEGVELDSAARVLAGQVPYRDFSLIYAPGQAYALAAVFRVFGESMVAERAYDLGVRLLLCIGVYALAREVSNSRAALAAYALATILLGSAYFYAYTMFPALLLALLSATACLRYFCTATPLRLFTAGLLAGAATLFRHDVGLYVTISEVAVLLPWALVHANGLRSSGVQIAAQAKCLAKSAWPFIAGLAIPIAPMGIFLVMNVPLADLWYAFVEFPLGDFRGAFALPYPDLSTPLSLVTSQDITWEEKLHALAFFDPYLTWALFWTQPLIDVAGLLYLATAMYQHRQKLIEQRPLWRLALVTFLAIALFNQGLNRADSLHLLPSGLLAFILLIGLVAHAFTGGRHRALALIGLLVTILLMTPSYLLWPLTTARDALLSTGKAPCAVAPQLSRAACVYIFPDQAQAIRFMEDVTNPNETVFVGNARNDRIEPNDALFYFISGRRNGTRFDDLAAGLVSTAPTQETIIAELNESHVNWIVLSSLIQDDTEPNAMGRLSGVTLLDDFIRRNYAVVQQFGNYTIWHRR